MGVSGTGKTTLGHALAERLNWAFIEADDFHPPQNVEKMRSGQPLSEGDRAPWLAAVHAALLDKDTYLCPWRTMYRILNERRQVREQRNPPCHPAYTKLELPATGPNQL